MSSHLVAALPQGFQGTVPQGWQLWLPHEPDRDFTLRRAIFLSEHAYQQCRADKPTSDKELKGQKHHNLIAALEGIAGGCPIQSDREMTWLEPHNRDLWEIRAFQTPQVRLLGWWAAKDVFFGTRAYPRDHLGQGNSPEWAEALDKCEKKRADLGLTPFVGAKFEDHMTNGRA